MFIVIEGADGTGKSTLAAQLANHLGATLTAEPSYGPIGWWVRKNLSDLPAVALPSASVSTSAILSTSPGPARGSLAPGMQRFGSAGLR